MIPLTEDMEYLALSYVWGPLIAIDKTISSKENLSDLLPCPAPRTIEDAITAVRGLDKRYLWVDRYCIWDAEDRHLQKQNMGRIYMNAIYTMVAVDGGNAESGLPGISSSRSIQPQLRTDAGVYVTTFSHLSQHLSKSVWASRGWTYQEAVLSRRCMFFTSDQVYFACKTSIHCEAVLQSSIPDPHMTQQALGPGIMESDGQLSFRLVGGEAPHVGRHLKQYTNRSLTFDTDALNAFKGILSAGNTYSYYGLPFLGSDHAFAWALAWRSTGRVPKGEAARRWEGQPTWSWTSLVSQIEYPPGFWFGRSTVIFVEDKDKQIVSITDLLQGATKAKETVIPEASKYLLVESYVAKVRLQFAKDSGEVAAHVFTNVLVPMESFWPRPGVGRAPAAQNDENYHQRSATPILSLALEHPPTKVGFFLEQHGQAFLDLPNNETLCSRFCKEE